MPRPWIYCCFSSGSSCKASDKSFVKARDPDCAWTAVSFPSLFFFSACETLLQASHLFPSENDGAISRVTIVVDASGILAARAKSGAEYLRKPYCKDDACAVCATSPKRSHSATHTRICHIRGSYAPTSASCLSHVLSLISTSSYPNDAPLISLFLSHVLAPVFVSTYYSLTIIAFHLDYSPDRLCTPQRLSVPHATTALSRRPPTFVRRCCSRTRPRSCLHAIATPTLRLVFHSALCLPYDMCLLHVLSLPIALLMCRSQAICDSNDSPISPSISKPTVRRPTSLSIRALALARSRFRSPLTQLSISRFDIRRTFDVSAYPVTTLTLPSLGLL